MHSKHIVVIGLALIVCGTLGCVANACRLIVSNTMLIISGTLTIAGIIAIAFSMKGPSKY